MAMMTMNDERQTDDDDITMICITLQMKEKRCFF